MGSEYKLLRGKFVIRYPDLPRSGPEPDGDTVKFVPDKPKLVDDLQKLSGVPARQTARGISVRLEAIDALETHFQNKHQELEGAEAARDAMLDSLGFSNVVFFDDLPNKVESADQDSVTGYVLSNGIDANGRLIGFVFTEQAGATLGKDGDSVQVSTAAIDKALNTKLLKEGHVYPAFYETLPKVLREHLAVPSREARTAGRGIRARAKADKNGPAKNVTPRTLQKLVIWPKLFRRIVSYFASGPDDLAGFIAWLRADPVSRNDKITLRDGTATSLSEILTMEHGGIQMTEWPEDFTITPDPA